MNRNLTSMFVAGTLLGLPAALFAGPTMDEPEEDAGQSISSAVDVRAENGGPVMSLKGSLKGTAGFRGDMGDWVDLYRINIVDPFQFNISTFNLGEGGVRDPLLFLFDAEGKPLIAMNNIDENNLQARLINMDPSGNPLFNEGGIFYLGITTSWFEPGVWEEVDGQPRFMPIFEMGASQNFFGPVYPSEGFGNVVFSDWGGAPNQADAGEYEMSLTGVGSVPAPGAVALLGLAALGSRRRRRA